MKRVKRDNGMNRLLEAQAKPAAATPKAARKSQNGAARKNGAAGKVALKSLSHQEATRKNLPTIENESFVPEDVKRPKLIDYPRMSVTLYPRNCDADPQLVWRGKDHEDMSGDLAVKSLPIYVHEHITPQYIIQSLIDDSQGRSLSPELFERDFNGLTEEQRLKFYAYDAHWQNRMILGDSLAVMASLSEKEGLRGKVQTVFIDPPYGIDFASNWQVSTRQKVVIDGRASEISAEPEQIRAFRDTWKDGIHSYLTYLRDRFTASRDLLTETGSIFVQISAVNEHLVRSLLDEVFGAQNFCSLITFRKKTMPLGAKLLESISDYIIWYAKNKDIVKYQPLFSFKDVTGDSHWDRYEMPDGSRHKMSRAQVDGVEALPEGAQIYQLISMSPAGFNENNVFDFEYDGKTYKLKSGKSWNTSKEGMARLASAGRLEPYSDGETLRYVLKLEDYPVSQRTNLWSDVGAPPDKVYVVQTNTEVIKRCILMTTTPGDLVLDPTCGGGTTAYVAEQWGRRWITIDTSRVSLALTRARLMSAVFPYYKLLDSHDGRLEDARLSGFSIASDAPPPAGDLKKGFVYERVRHLSREDITNNTLIAANLMPGDVERTILASAPKEYLVDRPLVDKSAVRVAGPFTVESLAPGEAQPLDAYRDGTAKVEQADFVEIMLDNIKTSGISNGEKGGRTRFTSVEPFPGEFVEAIAISEDGQRFAISVGPKEGTVGKRFMIDAGREALDNCAADVLAVCGFAFEDAAKAERIGSLLILRVRMNQDLQIGDLLKKSKNANLFQVYGEPDIKLSRSGNEYTVQVRGMDIYDPAKREIRSAGTDRIQAWFVDTNYDGERFIVRHAYFLGDDSVFEDLQRALKGEIDEQGWSSVYSDTSRPFPPPKTGKIAIKVITVYGDETIVVKKV
jgi:adenine-specific DNA-methyltransferase